MEFLTIEIVSLWVATFASCAEILLVLIALRALDQVSQQRKQNELTKGTSAVGELRHLETLIQEWEQVSEEIKNRNGGRIVAGLMEMQDFDVSEIEKSEYKDQLRRWRLFVEKNEDLYKKVLALTNKLEVISTALVHGTANIKIIEESIAPSICTFVEQFAYVYVAHRTDNYKLFPNTMTLYNMLKPKAKSIQKQATIIRQHLVKLEEDI